MLPAGKFDGIETLPLPGLLQPEPVRHRRHVEVSPIGWQVMVKCHGCHRLVVVDDQDQARSIAQAHQCQEGNR